MSTGSKKYIVRKGFNFRIRDDKGNEKIFHEDDTVTLEKEFGDLQHQLEYADDRDRAAAAKAEVEAAAKTVANVVSGSTAPSFDYAALAAAITAGIASAASPQPATADATKS